MLVDRNAPNFIFCIVEAFPNVEGKSYLKDSAFLFMSGSQPHKFQEVMLLRDYFLTNSTLL